MSSDARIQQPHLTPEQRREMLRAFADRMLVKITQMDDPEDLPGVERAVRVAAVIERLYSRCDRAEQQTPDPRQLQIERARRESAAFKAKSALAWDLYHEPPLRKQLGQWWTAAETIMAGPAVAPEAVASEAVATSPVRMAKAADVRHAHHTETKPTAPGHFPAAVAKSPLPPP
jgi:hypothetical protein